MLCSFLLQKSDFPSEFVAVSSGRSALVSRVLPPTGIVALARLVFALIILWQLHALLSEIIYFQQVHCQIYTMVYIIHIHLLDGVYEK